MARLRDFLWAADRARDRCAFIAGYIAALRDIQRTGMEPFGEGPRGTMHMSAEQAWLDHSGGQ